MFDAIVSYATVALLSLALGSFFSVVVMRVGSAIGGRSRCLRCNNPLRARDLVPVLSWLALRGRCRDCQAAIALFYPGIELTTLGVGLSAAATSSGIDLGFRLFLGFSLVLLAGFDLYYMLLPRPLTAAIGGIGLLHAGLNGGKAALQAAALGWITGFAALWLVKWAYRHLRQREGLGGGDIWLFAAAGAWLGAACLPWVMLVAAGLGILVYWPRLSMMERLPFGPWLAVAMWIMLLASHSCGWAWLTAQ